MSEQDLEKVKDGMEYNLVRALDHLFVLQLLSERDMYIKEITQTVNKYSRNISISDPYSAVAGLMAEGSIAYGENKNSKGRSRRYYTITEKGLKKLETAKLAYIDFASGVTRLIKKSEKKKAGNQALTAESQISEES